MQSDFVVYAHNLVKRCQAQGEKYAGENTGSQSNFGLVSELKNLGSNLWTAEGKLFCDYPGWR